ncbi:MAG TPA: UDP-N-acetylmuramoyl-L-alanine--D-glutamate ligase [Candidatus Saccharimonadales bacterium]|nr:UDP-N-acetylmuramoyl-L-alanine--D-glutamate ligase [Candidatus Saccharimonadales bacterium]
MGLKLAILGFGDEGQSAYRYFKAQGAEITVFDEAAKPKYTVPSDVKLVTGADAFENLMGFDKVLRGSPAIRPDRFETDGERTSITKEFFRLCPTKKIIGVTATKGKGTITTLVRDILQAAGLQAHLAGNVGVPALDILDEIGQEDVAVLELSSFQLWDMEESPHIAVVGMIEPEHLEVHKDFAEYVGAKANIAKFQTAEDMVIYHPTNTHSAAIAAQSAGQKIRYNSPEGAMVQGDAIVIDGQRIVATSEVGIPGAHNLDNICAAITAAWQYTQDVAAIATAVRAFKGLEHRLQFVREVGEVSYYNDSISTTVGSVIAAIQAFEPAHEILIIGGSYSKGVDFAALADCIAEKKPKQVLFVGPIGEEIAALATARGYHGEVYNKWQMAEIVKRAAELAKPGDKVILSPATASFGDFANYKDRGNQFKAAVEKL